jgi:hypothetical protein
MGKLPKPDAIPRCRQGENWQEYFPDDYFCAQRTTRANWSSMIRVKASSMSTGRKYQKTKA